MTRVAYMLRIRKGMEEGCVEAHRNVWPDLIRSRIIHGNAFDLPGVDPTRFVASNLAG